ncbi:hypothetical protein FACS189483_08800 [Spirochaetia bacterium]|nr:hypothetical protein FACS189483_08800 [Spirochaetia bacterium]
MGRALNTNRLRLIIFAGVALLHVVLILFFAITVDAVALTPEPPEIVMKITDLREETP